MEVPVRGKRVYRYLFNRPDEYIGAMIFFPTFLTNANLYFPSFTLMLPAVVAAISLTIYRLRRKMIVLCKRMLDLEEESVPRYCFGFCLSTLLAET